MDDGTVGDEYMTAVIRVAIAAVMLVNLQDTRDEAVQSRDWRWVDDLDELDTKAWTLLRQAVDALPGELADKVPDVTDVFKLAR